MENTNEETKETKQTDLEKFANWGDKEFNELSILKVEIDKPIELTLVEEPKEVNTRFGKSLLYTVMEKGIEMAYFSGSKRLAYAMLKAEIKVGDIFTLTRSGSGYETTYEIVKSENG